MKLAAEVGIGNQGHELIKHPHKGSFCGKPNRPTSVRDLPWSPEAYGDDILGVLAAAMTKTIDKDIKVVRAVKALMGSSSMRMLYANMNYLNSYFLTSPSQEVIKKFCPDLLKGNSEQKSA